MKQPKLDEYNQVVNCWETAQAVREAVQGGDSVALPLSVGFDTMTRFQMVFAPIKTPSGAIWNGVGLGSGVFIAIERIGCYSLDWGHAPNEHGYMMEKWNLSLHDALALWPLFVGVLDGVNKYEGWDARKEMEKVMMNRRAA